MNIRTIYTENPNEETWKILLKYSYEVHMKSFLGDSGEKSDLRKEVSGSIMQAHSYFKSAKSSSMYIRPLLLYYGGTNLLNAIGILKSGNSLSINGHGMKADVSKDIGESSIKTTNPTSGALQIFSNIYSNSLSLANGSFWTFKEIISGLIDLKDDFEATYSKTPSKTIPVEVIKQKNSDLYRIPLDEIVNHDKANLFKEIEGFSDNYLRPSKSHGYFILRRNINSKNDCCSYSLLGKRYLKQGFNKGGLKSPSNIMLYYMGLFILCCACRYSSAIWHPFILKDETGERYLVEKFLALSARHLPQLVLEELTGKRIIFSKENKPDLDLRNEFTKEEIEQIVTAKFREHSLRGLK